MQRLSCAEHMLGHLPFADKLDVIAAAGFDGVDVRWSTLADEASRTVLYQHSLPLASVYSEVHEPGLLSRTARERADAIDQLVERAAIAAEAGASNLIFVPILGAARLAGAGALFDVEYIERALLLAAFAEIAQRVAGLAITLTLEPLNRHDTHLVSDPLDAAALCGVTNSPRFATMIDTYHCAHEQQNTTALVGALGSQLALVHLSDTDRRLPGAGTFDFAALVRVLYDHSYSSWCGFECRPPIAIDALSQSVRYVRELERNVGGMVVQ